ncbi:MAG: serpin family protein [Vulcanimicrobiota bacterium]
MKKIILLSMLLALLVISASIAPIPAMSQGDSEQALARDNGAFAFSLYGELKQEKGNIFFSPYSISTALAMTYLGARGTTAAEMAKTLHFTKDTDKLHHTFGALINDLNGRGSKDTYQLIVANRLWGQKGYKFLKSFLDEEQKCYGSSLETVDYKTDTEGARKTINTWVEKQTNDKIKELLAKGLLNGSTRLVLTNAIYFKSAWEEEFSERATRKDAFYLNETDKVQANLMHRTDNFGYRKSDLFDVAEIPYQRGELSMVVVLPHKINGLSDVERSLTYDKLKGVMSKMSSSKLELTLPKFKTTSTFGLGTTLEKMGMKSAFRVGSADFSGMDGTKTLFISEVVHKAFVDVNEKGTEAAAATAVVMRAGSAAPRPETIIPFKVDHPFIFLIRDRKTDSILFMGRIQNPVY